MRRPHVIAWAVLLAASLSTGLGQVILSGSGLVGRGCKESPECGPGAYCAGTKTCACLSTFVEVDGYCWEKVNPGESGCRDDRQCEAVWPGSFCRKGACRCANNQPPYQTRDGPVCINYGSCPLGEESSKYQDPKGNPLKCSLGLDATCVEGYDCICGVPQEDCASPTALNFCCPSRGLACILPKDEGVFPSGGSPHQRFYFNPQTGTCQVMSYRGAGGNANNFLTKLHCESYCTQSCGRGSPQYTKVEAALEKGRVKASVRYCNSNRRDCQGDYQCEAVGSQELCCPKPAFVCSKRGGLEGRAVLTTNFDPGTSVTSGVSFARFYYDEEERRCLPFTYLGQGGNFNHFLSQSHCEQFCSRIVCEAGEPLKDNGGMANLACGRNVPCPASHVCTHSLCCPTRQTVCKLGRAVGSCGAYATRWWFNADSGNCQEFQYSGCQGNSNNFPTYRDCTDYCRDVRREPQCPQGKALQDSQGDFVNCGGDVGDSVRTRCPTYHHCHFDGHVYGCCPSQAHTCSLPSEPGVVCGPRVSRWYFDQPKAACLTFQYNGCDGNSNNFATQQDCKDYCRVEACPEGGEPLSNSKNREVSCETDVDCPSTHTCSQVVKKTVFGIGVAPLCCPTKSFICSQPRNFGARCGSSSLRRWFFDSEARLCRSFDFKGCSGNRNNFASRAACENFCHSAACPAGLVALGSEGSLCDADRNAGCPAHHTCLMSALLRQPVCCGAGQGNEKICPAGSRPFVDALSLEPRQCTVNVKGSCPPQYYCYFNHEITSTGAYYCCSLDEVDFGGPRRRPAKPTVGSETGALAPSPATSPAGAQVRDSDLCPPGLRPLKGSATPYRRCSPTASGDEEGGCGAGVPCQHSAQLSLFICCDFPRPPPSPPGHGADLSGCPPQPPGLRPVLLNAEPLSCSPSNPASCPGPSAFCLFSPGKLRYMCCRLGGAESGLSGPSSSAQPAPSTTLLPVEPRSECSNAPGFVPVADEERSCDPLTPNSCQRFQRPGHAHHCLHNLQDQSYNCCLTQTTDS